VQVLADYQIEPTPGSTLYAITLPGIHSSPQVKAFVQFLAETVQAEFPPVDLKKIAASP